jgi:hypothetical protein
MKKLLIVISVTLFAHLSQGFVTASNTTSESKVSKAAFGDIDVSWGYDGSHPPASEDYIRIYVNDVLTVSSNGGSGDLMLSAGDVVRVEVGITPPIGMILNIVDDTPSSQTQLYYNDNFVTTSFSFTVQEGHTYSIQANS